MNRSTRLSLPLVSTLCALAVGPAAHALESYVVGPRALGMGGANVASVDNGSAQYYNPAAFGYFNYTPDSEAAGSDNNALSRKKWGVSIDASVGERMQDRMGEYIDAIDEVDTDSLNAGNIDSASELQDAIRLVNSLANADDPGNGLTIDSNAGATVRISHFAVGARGFMQASARIDNVDTTNLGANGANLDAEIQALTGIPDDGVQLFTSAQQTELSNGGFSADSIQKLDYEARATGMTASETDDFVDIMVAANNSTGSIDNNTTSVLVTGFGLAEIPVTYGRALNDNISVGASLKAMIGRVYGKRVLVFQDDSNDTIKEIEGNYKQSVNVGLDLGVMARIPHFNFGIVGRNLNAPKFEGPTVDGVEFDDVRVDPQVTVGAAFLPWKTFTVEADVDLLKGETTLDGFDTQMLRAGLEWDAFRFLALRGGAYKNLAQDDVGLVYTASIGINFWLMRIDAAGAISTKSSEIDGKKVPREARGSIGLAVDF